MAKTAGKSITANSFDLSLLTNDELFQLRNRVEKELKKREVKFSAGDVGELLAINHFNTTPKLSNLQKANTGTKGVDAYSKDGKRYSIKTVQGGTKTGTIYPDREDKDIPIFEFILMILLDENYDMTGLYRFSWKQFIDVRKWDITMNAWYLPKTRKAINLGETIYEK